jgi:hypothetical protein
MSQIHFEIQTSSDQPGTFRVVGVRTGRVYATCDSLAIAKVEAANRERRLLVRRGIKARVNEILECGEEDDNIGICMNCGAEHDGVEPDAEGYPCDECGETTVVGFQNLVLSLC